MAIIKVGAATEAAMKEKKDRVDDALHATRAAVEEGIVPGGGVAYLRCQKAIDGLTLTGDEKVGAEIVARAIEAPLRKLVSNAGQEAALVVAKVKADKGSNGYNVRQGRAHRPPERGLHRGPPAHHGLHGHGHSREEGLQLRQPWRPGRHGRHDVIHA